MCEVMDQKGICMNCSEAEKDFELNVRKKILFSMQTSHKGPLKRPQGSWQRESYHRATPGLTLVPATLRINL